MATAAAANITQDIDFVLFDESHIATRVSQLAAEITADFASTPPLLVGVATGALLFLSDLVRELTLPVSLDFLRVESYGDGTESCGKPRISADTKIDVNGKDVILVEDIVDTGSTVSCLIAHMKKKGATSVSVCTLLDKPARRKVAIELAGDGKFYRGFECPDHFVVGYGMDYAEKYRNLPYVGVLKADIYAKKEIA